MNLYLISNPTNGRYDKYYSAIVAADSEDEAKLVHPSGREEPVGYDEYCQGWCAIDDVAVELIGVAAESVDRGVVMASFHAG